MDTRNPQSEVFVPRHNPQSGFPWKSTLAILTVFAVVIAACLLWTPIRVRRYLSLFRSEDKTKRVAAVDGLIALGKKGRKELRKELGCGKAELEFIVKHWHNVDTKLERKNTPLGVASLKGYASAVRLFILKGAEINALGTWSPTKGG